jgi:hypothetical protein
MDWLFKALLTAGSVTLVMVAVFALGYAKAATTREAR